MFVDFGYRGGHVPRSDGCEQLAMSRLNLRQSGAAGVVLHDRDAELRADRLVNSNQERIPGEFAQRLVESNILFYDLRQIIGQAGLLHRANDSFQVTQSLRRVAFEQVRCIGGGDLRDNRPMPWLDGDETLLPQALDRLAHRSPADPHILSQAGFIETVARLQTPLRDAVAQLLVDLLADWLLVQDLKIGRRIQGASPVQ